MLIEPMFGRVIIPKDWEMQTNVTFIEPAKSDFDLPIAGEVAPPRANVIFSRSLTKRRSTREACDEFIKTFRDAFINLKVSERRQVKFADGAPGTSIIVTLDASHQVTLAQRHVFRIDDQVVTQCVATILFDRRAEFENEIGDILLSFAPQK